MILFSPSLRGVAESVKVKTPASSAFGMIQGHRSAFSVGRYGYELPGSPKLKPILYNKEGLQILSWLSRALAYHVVKEVKEAKEAKRGQADRQTAKVTLPTGLVDKFPPP